MSEPDGGFAHAALRLAAAPETLLTFVVLGLAWGSGAAGILPKEVWVVDFPALAVAFFVDTLAYNEFVVRENSVFYPALAVSLYLEALVVGAVVRWVRRTRLVDFRRDSAE